MGRMSRLNSTVRGSGSCARDGEIATNTTKRSTRQGRMFRCGVRRAADMASVASMALLKNDDKHRDGCDRWPDGSSARCRSSSEQLLIEAPAMWALNRPTRRKYGGPGWI